MAGTYNEVEVKKLGQKKASKAKKLPKQSLAPLNSAPGHGPENPGTQEAAAWPPILQDFVNRSFAQADGLTELQKVVFNEQIQALIYAAARDKKIWTNNWTAQTLPIFNPSVPFGLHQDIVLSTVQNQTVSPAPTVALAGSQDQYPSERSGGKKPANFDSSERKRQRAARFQDSVTRSPSPVPVAAPSGGKAKHIIGTLTALEKRYLRLTSEPDPSLVRPSNVLGHCLKHVVNKYRTTGASYLYINDQLKAIRQDLTVQHLKGNLAVKVYETHGRIAIENNDLGEFNQCQAQLKHLYAAKEHPDFYKYTYEFTCYRILYLLLTGNYADINLTRLEILDTDAAVSEADLEPEFVIRRQCVYKALEIADFVTLGNYHGFFKLYKWYKALDGMDGAFHLIDQFMANKQRVLSLNTMCKAFKKLPLSFLEEQLVLGSPTLFFADYALEVYISGTDFDCTPARMALQAFVDQGTFKKVDIKGQV